MSKSDTDKNNLVDFLADSEAKNEPTQTLQEATIGSSPSADRQQSRTNRATKLGRRSFKLPNVTYARLTIDIPEGTKELLDLARVKSGNPHKGKHSAVIVDEALRAYLGHGQ